MPAWIRKILLRGLATEPKDRYPSMTELLAALGHDPAVRRRRWLTAVMAAAFVAAGARRRAPLHRRPARDLRRRSGPRGDRLGPRPAGGDRARVRQERKQERGACVRRRDLARRSIPRALDRDVRRDLRGDAGPRRTVGRGARSAHGLPRRAALQRARARRRLPDGRQQRRRQRRQRRQRAADARSLRRRRDAARRDQAARRSGRARQGRRRARRGGQGQGARRLGPMRPGRRGRRGRRRGGERRSVTFPLQAEAHLALGRLGETCTDAAKAIAELEEAVFAAEASHHDQVLIEANIYLGVSTRIACTTSDAARNALGHAGAVLARFPGHPILEAWVADAERHVLLDEGRYEEALRENQKVLALREAALGSSHFEVAASDVERRPRVARTRPGCRGGAAHGPRNPALHRAVRQATAPGSR